MTGSISGKDKSIKEKENMKKIGLSGLILVMLFVLMPTVQAQSQSDDEFIAKLNGARYVSYGAKNVTYTWDIRGNIIISGYVCTQQTGGCKNKPLGSWWQAGSEETLNGRGFSVEVVCGWTTDDPVKEIKGLKTCKITEDSITCWACGEQTIYTRER